jgi:hypothetical protein
MTDDELDRALTGNPSGPSRKADVLAASIRALPRRGYDWRRVAGSTLAAFLLGGAIAWVAKPVPAVEPERIIVKEIVEVPAPAPESESQPIAARAVNLDKLETEAELADPPTAARLYRQIGDLYLKQTDIPAATRCYRLHLNQAGPAALEAADGDSWLLISLKSSTRQENFR